MSAETVVIRFLSMSLSYTIPVCTGPCARSQTKQSATGQVLVTSGPSLISHLCHTFGHIIPHACGSGAHT